MQSSCLMTPQFLDFIENLRKSNKELIVKDFVTRYGTQTLMKSGQALDEKDSTNNVFQIGRTWFHASLKQK